MKLVADLHTHTVASGHAFGTLTEMVRAAADRGHQAIGITDHGPAMPHGAHQYYFSNMVSLPRELFGVTLYQGAEANIVGFDGALDIWPEIHPLLDYMIASMHIHGISPEGSSAKQNTETWKKVMQNPYVKILGHPENPYFPIIIEEFVAEAKRRNKVIEVNNASFIVRPGSEETLSLLVCEAKNQQALLAVTSDAHYMDRVGDFERALQLIEDLDIPDALIVNTSLEKIERHIMCKVI